MTSATAIAQPAASPTPVASPRAIAYDTVITGADVANFTLDESPETGETLIAFRLTDAAAARFYQYTSTHIGEPLAIVINHEVVATPTIQAAIASEGVVYGGYTRDEALLLVRQLKAGIASFALIDPRGQYLPPGTVVVTAGEAGAPNGAPATPLATPAAAITVFHPARVAFGAPFVTD